MSENDILGFSAEETSEVDGAISNDSEISSEGYSAEISEEFGYGEEYTGEYSGEREILGEEVYGDGVDAGMNGDFYTGGTGIYDGSMEEGGYYGDGMEMGYGGETSEMTGAKDPILSSVPFVAGTIGAALVLGIVLGILFGKHRIKKGFDSYEN